MNNRYTNRAEINQLKILPELITHHIPVRSDLPAVTDYDSAKKEWKTLTFGQLHAEAERWAKALTKAGLKKGDRVAMLLPNCTTAIAFDQGALRAGLVPVPLHLIDTPANCAFIIGDSGAKALIIMNRARWHAIEKVAVNGEVSAIETVIYVDDEAEEGDCPKIYNAREWLKDAEDSTLTYEAPSEDDLACLVYTSGTTGKPKGVMLTHKNVMSDVQTLLYNIEPSGTDVWLSFLPLSHMFERTTTYYIGLGMGNHVYFNRGIPRLLDDLKIASPTILMSVPRIYEKVYAKIQERLRVAKPIQRKIFMAAVEAGWRNFREANQLPPEEGNAPRIWDKLLDPFYERAVRKKIKDQFGGRLRVAVSGGAPLSLEVAKVFCGLGINIYQGYGMTETSPIVSVNRIGSNDPSTVGPIMPKFEFKLGAKDELLLRGPQVMKGYWQLPEKTAEVLTEDGWLSTGDQADILEGNMLRIKGRIKEIIMTSNGEKIAPVDVEQAMETDPLFAQTMVVGEGYPFVVAVIVLGAGQWEDLAKKLNVDPSDKASLTHKSVKVAVLKRIKAACKGLPQYGVPRSVCLSLEPWTIENNMLTPTLKIRRRVITAAFKKDIEKLYSDFGR